MGLRLRTVIVLTAVGIATLGTAAAAQGTQRYAAPAGSGTDCTQATPCSLDTAVENAAVVDGDEVIVTSGTYTTATVGVSDAITLHGEDPQAPPTINVSSGFGLSVNDAATVSDLRVESTSGPGLSVSASSAPTIERLYVHTASAGGTACVVTSSALLRDSVCWASGTNSKGVGSNLNGASDSTIRLRNVTAIGTTYGIGFDFNGTAATVTVDAKNVIAKGGSSFPAADVRAFGDLNHVNIVLDHSNYATEFEAQNNGGSASVTDPGSGTNQTALPIFVDAATGDFHQTPTSPTVEAGEVDAFTGTLDFDGLPRVQDADQVCPTLIDIGADERPAPALDCDPPETTIAGGPTAATNDATPTFTLQSDELNSTFECRVDGGSFTSCTSPYTTTPLADGSHTLEVRATDPGLNTDPTPDSRTFTVDTAPPDTTIAGGPDGVTADSTPTFTLQSSEPSSTFECRIDGGAFSSCSSPYTTPALADGGHTLEVKATDPALNTDPTPDTRTFTVDTNPPETTISGGPAGATADRTPTFTLGADEPGSSFECKLDGGAFAACSSPFTTPALSDGSHTLSVRAADPATNEDPTPATRAFRVDATAPQTTITAAPKAKLKTKRRKAKVSLSFAANEPGRFECSLDGAAFTACSSPQTAKVGKGKHVWAVRAIDRVGNVDGSPAQAKFTVKRKKKRR
jgi:hypothetical protein